MQELAFIDPRDDDIYAAPDELLEQDSIDDAEHGFMRGYLGGNYAYEI